MDNQIAKGEHPDLIPIKTLEVFKRGQFATREIPK